MSSSLSMALMLVLETLSPIERVVFVLREAFDASQGIDNILFSVDDPFSDNFEAMDFLNATELSKEDREKLAHGNAERLLKLSTDAQSGIASKQSFVPNLKSSMFTLKAKVKANLTRRVLSFLVK
jgi:Amidohydrolase